MNRHVPHIATVLFLIIVFQVKGICVEVAGAPNGVLVGEPLFVYGEFKLAFSFDLECQALIPSATARCFSNSYGPSRIGIGVGSHADINESFNKAVIGTVDNRSFIEIINIIILSRNGWGGFGFFTGNEQERKGKNNCVKQLFHRGVFEVAKLTNFNPKTHALAIHT